LFETSCQPIADQSTVTHRSISYSLTCCSSNDIVIRAAAATASSFSIMSTYSMSISTDSLCVFAFATSGGHERQGCARGHSDRQGCRIVGDYYYCLHRIECAGHLLGGKNLPHLRISRHHYPFLMKLLEFSQWIQVSWPISCLVS